MASPLTTPTKPGTAAAFSEPPARPKKTPGPSRILPSLPGSDILVGEREQTSPSKVAAGEGKMGQANVKPAAAKVGVATGVGLGVAKMPESRFASASTSTSATTTPAPNSTPPGLTTRFPSNSSDILRVTYRSPSLTTGTIVSVSCTNGLPSPLPKPVVQRIHLLRNCGALGDMHSTPYPNEFNLRQISLVRSELLPKLSFKPPMMDRIREIGPGQLGENITTAGLEIEALMEGTFLILVEEEFDVQSYFRFHVTGQKLLEVAEEGQEKGVCWPVLKVTGLRMADGRLDAMWGEGLRGKVEEEGVSGCVGIYAQVHVGGDLMAGMKIVAYCPWIKATGLPKIN